MELQLGSIITCPACGFAREETMSTNSCLVLYECTNCGALLRPQKGDCCVFCSYGSVDCPPKQQDGRCGSVMVFTEN
jgi:hypothetical protein